MLVTTALTNPPTTTAHTDIKPDDVIEVATSNDTSALRLRVHFIGYILGVAYAFGHEINQRGRTVGSHPFPLDVGIPYVVVPAARANWLTELLFGRRGRHRA